MNPPALLEDADMKPSVIAALTLPLLVLSGTCGLHAMGPDPGGHSGATVTPETTRTDNPAVDAARKATSGSKTETNETAGAPPADKKKK
jgi:hypothetical protein